MTHWHDTWRDQQKEDEEATTFLSHGTFASGKKEEERNQQGFATFSAKICVAFPDWQAILNNVHFYVPTRNKICLEIPCLVLTHFPACSFAWGKRRRKRVWLLRSTVQRGARHDSHESFFLFLLSSFGVWNVKKRFVVACCTIGRGTTVASFET